jgi:hypothetical protein
MATWPSYAEIKGEGFAENAQSALERTEMESGPPKQVRVRSRVMVQRPVKVLIRTAANYASWLTWFRTTIRHGADWFDWTDPRDSTTNSARIVGGVTTNELAAGVLGQWLLSMTLETWE